MLNKGVLTILVTLIAAWRVAVATAADHRDAPSLLNNPAMDINDVYAFQSPGTPTNSVFAVTVNPFSGLVPNFATGDSVYELLVDNNADAVPDITYSATFSGLMGSQSVMIARNGAPIGSGAVGTTINLAGGGTFQAGQFDDPFFFDLQGFRNGFNFTGTDTFAMANTSALVMELPSSVLGGPNIGVYARTLQNGAQLDRMGRPAINTAVIPTGKKEAFNQGLPENDRTNFGADAIATITSLSNSGNANGLTPILLPDLLTFDTSNASGFLNGRQLSNDVIDAELNLLSAGGVTTDKVGSNDRMFRDAFPYLATPNVPEPTTTALALMGVAACVRSMRQRHRAR